MILCPILEYMQEHIDYEHVQHKPKVHLCNCGIGNKQLCSCGHLLPGSPVEVIVHPLIPPHLFTKLIEWI